MDQIGIYRLEDARRIKTYVNNQLRDGGAESPRTPIFDSSVGGRCVNYWRLWLQSPYQPNTGDFDVTVVSYDADGDESTNTITIAYDASATDVAALLRDISDLGDGSDSASDNFVITGGPLPLNSLQISNKSRSGKRIKSLSVGPEAHTLSRAWPQCDAFVF